MGFVRFIHLEIEFFFREG